MLFKVYTNCKITRGFTRSVISDIQRQESEFIPNDLAEIIEKLKTKVTVEDLLTQYGIENRETLQDYLKFLEEKEYGFYCGSEEFDLFPEMDNSYVVPSHITNTIIELKIENIHILNSIVPQIEALGCKNIAIVFYEALSFNNLMSIFPAFKDTRIKSVEITFKYASFHTQEFIENFNENVNQLTKLTFFDAPENKVELWDDKIFFDRIWTNKDIKSFKSCGVVDTKYFNTNLPKVLEAMNHNSCLNMKLAIDVNGDIRNCPSMPTSYGNIKETTLKEAINKPGFKKYWNLTKDEIEICKDCEFRYICTDCRAYTERTHTNAEDLDTSKPLKCGYNPYTREWTEWSANPLKKKVINFYCMQDLVKKEN